MAVISKEEFLRACNQKIKQDNDLADRERRRQEEEERRRQEEEARRLQEEARIRQEQREWDAWYNRLPSNCKNGFTFNGFSYSVNPSTRSITKTPLNIDINDDVRLKDIFIKANRNFASSSVNQELGI